jgi:hypothetical protein
MVFLPIREILLVLLLMLPAATLFAQADDICGEFGYSPSLDAPRLSAPYVYGRVVVKGLDVTAKFPKISVIYLNREQSPNRMMIGKSGNYCFRRSGGMGGTLIVDLDGVEVVRRSLSTFGTAQQREDFEVFAKQEKQPAPPGVVSAKFVHPRNEKTVELYNKAADAEQRKEPAKAITYVMEIVSIDPADFVAWAILGTLHFEQNKLSDAEAACRKALELKIEYTPAWLSVGRIRMAQKQFAAAIEIFKHAASLEPSSARAFQLLGESYLQNRQGTLGVEALNKAIELDPIGMAECHLQLAHLYQLAKANELAAKEYKMFLAKVPDHPERKKFEKYIADNPVR